MSRSTIALIIGTSLCCVFGFISALVLAIVWTVAAFGGKLGTPTRPPLPVGPRATGEYHPRHPRLSKAEAPKLATVTIHFTFKCGSSGEVYDNVPIDAVTLINGTSVRAAKVESHKATIDNLPLDSRWKGNVLFNGTRRVKFDLLVDNSPLQHRTCSITLGTA